MTKKSNDEEDDNDDQKKKNSQNTIELHELLYRIVMANVYAILNERSETV